MDILRQKEQQGTENKCANFSVGGNLQAFSSSAGRRHMPPTGFHCRDRCQTGTPDGHNIPTEMNPSPHTHTLASSQTHCVSLSTDASKAKEKNHQRHHMLPLP